MQGNALDLARLMKEEREKQILRFKGVSKRYGALTALDDVSLSVEPGEIFALLGPNGAGKTTMIGCASGLIQDFDGQIRIGGYDVRADYRITRRLVGLVPQELNFDGFFTASQALFYQSGYYGIRPDKARIHQILKDFSLHDKANTNTRRLSGGMKRRLMVCKALMHEPALLFLDEPTAGVDVELREELWQYVLRLREQGVTIVLTTHYLEEAEQLADRIGIISDGRILRVQSRDSLLSELGQSWMRVGFSQGADAALFSDLTEGVVRQVDERSLRFEISGTGEADAVDEHLIAQVVERARERGLVVTDVAAGRSSLEEVFKGLLQGAGNRQREAAR